MTFEELLNKFAEAFPSAEIDDYRPVYPQLFQAGKFGITIWLKNGDMVVYYPKEENKEKEVWCTECPYFIFVKDDNDDIWYYGAKCHKDGHEAEPSMYAVQSLHDDCPLRQKEESKEDEEVWCTECPYFKDVTDTPGEWFGALCTKDGHEAGPSMYAIQSLHNNCPLKQKEGE